MMLNRQGSVVRVDPATIPSRLSLELEAEQKVGCQPIRGLWWACDNQSEVSHQVTWSAWTNQRPGTDNMTWPCLGRGRVGGALPQCSLYTRCDDHDVTTGLWRHGGAGDWAGGRGQVRGGSRAWRPHLLSQRSLTRKWAISGLENGS